MYSPSVIDDNEVDFPIFLNIPAESMPPGQTPGIHLRSFSRSVSHLRSIVRLCFHTGDHAPNIVRCIQAIDLY